MGNFTTTGCYTYSQKPAVSFPSARNKVHFSQFDSQVPPQTRDIYGMFLSKGAAEENPIAAKRILSSRGNQQPLINSALIRSHIK